MKVLFTGFKGYNNSSNVVVKKITDKIGTDILLFNNSYEKIDKQLTKINIEDYDFILMLGLRNNLRKSIRLEVNSYLDNELLTTNISYEKIIKYFTDNRVNCLINFEATNYLCNYAYYKILKRNKNTIFIHLPSLTNIKDLDKLIDLISNITA